jgi:class 3 adenylate cyclase
VVTGEMDWKKGTHGLAGDTINVAARLCSISEIGEILVGSDTFHQAGGYFEFQSLEPISVKGKCEAVNAYRVLKTHYHPRKVHRLHGVRSKLIGRKVEINSLFESLENLRHGQGSIISVCGTAGSCSRQSNR